MSKGIITVILFLITNCLVGQSFFDGDPKWYVQIIGYNWGEPHSRAMKIFRIGKDTLIGNVPYKQIEESKSKDEQNWRLSPFVVREKGDTVFVLESGEERIGLINDMVVGDSYKPDRQCDYRITDVLVKEREGLTHEYYAYGLNTVNDTLIKGVGSLNAMFKPLFACLFDVGKSELRCLYRNGELTFSRDGNDCYQGPTSTHVQEREAINVQSTLIRTGETINVSYNDIDISRILIYSMTGQLEQEIRSQFNKITFNTAGIKAIIFEGHGNKHERRVVVVP